MLALKSRTDSTGTEDEEEEGEEVEEEEEEERGGRGDYRRAAVKEHPASSLRGAIAARETCTTGRMVVLAQLRHLHSPGGRGQRAQLILYFGDGGRVFKNNCSKHKLIQGASGFCCPRCSAPAVSDPWWFGGVCPGEGTAPAGRSADTRGGSLPLKERPPKM